MDAVTYPDERVTNFIMEQMIPLRLPYDHKLYSKQFDIKWTPSLIVLDSEGKESYRSIGFAPPEELIPMLKLGEGKGHFAAGHYEKAIEAFDFVIGQYPKSKAAAEAIYFRGVSLYKHTDNPKPLREAYDKLSTEYPDAEWTKKAYPYRLID